MDDFEHDSATVARGLGHPFDDVSLLHEALTHRSFSNERRSLAPRDNDRLEFFGDAVLGWVVAKLLWDRFPEATAGELTRRRADLVCEERLAAIARGVGIGRALRLGRGEARQGGSDKPRLLASALEACIAAVYLDGGVDAAFGSVQRLLSDELEREAPGAHDFKTRVQELLQRRHGRTPTYELLETTGPDHARRFRVALCLGSERMAEGEGHSKLEAEQAAAREAHRRLQEETHDPEDVPGHAVP